MSIRRTPIRPSSKKEHPHLQHRGRAAVVFTVHHRRASNQVHLAVPLAITVALIIATMKGSMVAAIFMHLSHEKKWIYGALILTVVVLRRADVLPLLTVADTIGTPSPYTAAAEARGESRELRCRSAPSTCFSSRVGGDGRVLSRRGRSRSTAMDSELRISGPAARRRCRWRGLGGVRRGVSAEDKESVDANVLLVLAMLAVVRLGSERLAARARARNTGDLLHARRRRSSCSPAFAAFFVYLFRRASAPVRLTTTMRPSIERDCSMLNLLGCRSPASAHAGEIDQMLVLVHWLMLVLFVGWGVFFLFVLVGSARAPTRRRATSARRASSRRAPKSPSRSSKSSCSSSTRSRRGRSASRASRARATPSSSASSASSSRGTCSTRRRRQVRPDGSEARAADNPLGLDRTDPDAKDDIDDDQPAERAGRIIRCSSTCRARTSSTASASTKCASSRTPFPAWKCRSGSSRR